MVAVVDGVTSALPAEFDTVTVYTAVVDCELDGKGVSSKEADVLVVPTGNPSFCHTQLDGGEPVLHVTDKVSEAPPATTGLVGEIVQAPGFVTALTVSATFPDTTLQRVGWSA